MTVQIALLRAVNVAGNNKVAMADLKAMMSELGFEARTVLQSGNVLLKGARLAMRSWRDCSRLSWQNVSV